MILTAVTAAVAELLTDGNGASGAVRMVAGLCVLLALIQPVKEGILWLRGAAEGEPEEWVSLPEGDGEAQAVFQEQLNAIGEQAVTEAVRAVMKERFGVSSDQCRVEAAVILEATGQEVRTERIDVTLSGTAVLKNPRTIKAYLEQTFGCECVVTTG